MSKKIFTTILVIFAVLAMIFLGFWQLDRHSQKSDINERISARLDNEPLGLVDMDKLKSYEIIEMERILNTGALLFQVNIYKKIAS